MHNVVIMRFDNNIKLHVIFNGVGSTWYVNITMTSIIILLRFCSQRKCMCICIMRYGWSKWYTIINVYNILSTTHWCCGNVDSSLPHATKFRIPFARGLNPKTHLTKHSFARRPIFPKTNFSRQPTCQKPQIHFNMNILYTFFSEINYELDFSFFFVLK